MNPFNATLISFGFECCAFGVALFHASKLLSRYLPFLFSLGLGFFNDVLSLCLMFSGKGSLINGNIFVLFDLLIIIWFFKNISTTSMNYFLTIIGVVGIVLWILDNIILHSIQTNNSLYRMVASALIVLMSLEKLGDIMLFKGPDRILRTDVLILLGMLFYYAFKTFIESYNVFQMRVQITFYINLFLILATIHIITYILFSLAIIWAPKKKEFISHL